MYKNKSFLAIIPARGGSKGIPRKNIIDVNGKPLIKYTIDSAHESKYIDRIIVSTEDEEIAEVALRYGVGVPFLRPAELAEDEAKTIEVLVDVLEKLKDEGQAYDYLVLLQPTQPLRRGFHIDEAIKRIVDEEGNGLVSVSEVKEHPILMRTVDKYGNLQSLLKTSSDVRRQDFEKIYKVNGAIYINKIDEDFNKNVSLNDNTLGYIMDKRYDIDIDEPEDLRLLKSIVQESEEL